MGHKSQEKNKGPIYSTVQGNKDSKIFILSLYLEIKHTGRDIYIQLAALYNRTCKIGQSQRTHHLRDIMGFICHLPNGQVIFLDCLFTYQVLRPLRKAFVLVIIVETLLRGKLENPFSLLLGKTDNVIPHILLSISYFLQLYYNENFTPIVHSIIKLEQSLLGHTTTQTW